MEASDKLTFKDLEKGKFYKMFSTNAFNRPVSKIYMMQIYSIAEMDENIIIYGNYCVINEKGDRNFYEGYESFTPNTQIQELVVDIIGSFKEDQNYRNKLYELENKLNKQSELIKDGIGGLGLLLLVGVLLIILL